MSDDLIERLRVEANAECHYGCGYFIGIAADEIERLRRLHTDVLAQLRSEADEQDDPDDVFAYAQSMGLRRAIAIFEQHTEPRVVRTGAPAVGKGAHDE